MPNLFSAEASITCHRPMLLDAVTALAKVVPTRTPKEVLRMVRFVADPSEGTAYLEGTDLEVAVRHRILGVDVGTDRVDVLLPADRFIDLLRVGHEDKEKPRPKPGESPPEEETSAEAAAEVEAAHKVKRRPGKLDPTDRIAITPGATNVTIAGRKWKAVLPTFPTDTFPSFPGFETPDFHVVSAADLARALRRTIIATDPKAPRQTLTGCLFEPDQEGLRFLATDTRRLANQLIPADVEGMGMHSRDPVVVPLKALKTIARLLADDDPPVHIGANDRMVMIRTEAAIMTALLVVGRFPRYQDVYPPPPTTIALALCGDLLDAASRARVTTAHESRGVWFRFDGNKLTVSAEASDVGKGETEVDIQNQTGGPVSVELDVRYLVDMLKTFERDSVTQIELIDAEHAIVFRMGKEYSYPISTIGPPEEVQAPPPKAKK